MAVAGGSVQAELGCSELGPRAGGCSAGCCVLPQGCLLEPTAFLRGLTKLFPGK